MRTKNIHIFILIILTLIACDKTTKETEVPVSSISLNQTTAEMIIGETVQLQVSISPSNATDKTVLWGASKPSVATVTNNGLVTAVAEGNSTISATAGGKSASCQVTVSKGVVAVASVELDNTELTLHKWESKVLTATVSPPDATDKTITWSSSNTSIATVDKNGKVDAKEEGSATISAKAGEKTATCSITVEKRVIPVSSITINRSELSLHKGQSRTLSASVSPLNATDKTVTWSSSNSSIATVDNGAVMAINEGNAIITAHAGGKSATCSVIVKQALPNNAVDLGLDVCWAQCNLGAANSTDPGDYYAWGETETYYKPGHSKDSPMDPANWKPGKSRGYDWDSYKWYNGLKTIKYNGVDNKRELEPDDDVAHVTLGGSWRMPTKQDWRELSSECTWVWDKDKVCYVVTGPNNNSIFLPVASYRIWIYLRDPETGRYWTSNLYEYEPYEQAYCVRLSPSTFGYDLLYDYRPRGLMIRPVVD